MRQAHSQQRDFFDDRAEEAPFELEDEHAGAPRREPIAIPCGFSTKSNRPCQRRAQRPVMLEGHQMTCRGRPMLFCDPACFEGGDDAAAVDENLLRGVTA